LLKKVYGPTRDALEAALRDDEPDRATVAGAVKAYLGSRDFARLSPSTQDAYTRYLARFTKTFGTRQLALFEHFRIRKPLTDWRDQWAATPRGADYMMRAVGAFFKWARGRGLTSAEPIRGVTSLHSSNRSDRIWTAADIDALTPHATPALMRAVLLAVETGLRLGDLIALTWSQIDDDTVQLITRKTGGVVVVPLTPGAKAVLAGIDRGDGPVLKGQRGRPWTADGIKTEFQKAKTKAGVDLRFHDLRGTAATRFRSLGYTNEEIARAMGWTVSAVEVLMTRYVKNADVMRAAIARVNSVPN
jgi:integrase